MADVALPFPRTILSPLSCTSVLAARMLHRALSRSESWLLARTHVRRHAGTHARALTRSLLLRRRRHLTSYGACSTVSLRRVVEANVADHHTCHACEERHVSVCRLLLVHIMAGHERIGVLDTRSSIVNEHLGPFRALLSTNKMSTEHLRYLGMFWCA